MDQETIKRAAVEAVGDLQLDCEIREIGSSPGGDGWCVQFSGKYGQFCDEFKNQFGRENSFEVAREKIKSYLLKQVTKIRSGTGRRRTGRESLTERRGKPESTMLTAPLKMVGEVFGQAVEMASPIIEQATAATRTALDAAAEVARRAIPRELEVDASIERSGGKSSGASVKQSPRKSARKSRKQAGAAKGRAARTEKQVAGGMSNEAQKAGRSARKNAARAKKSATASTKRKASGKKK